MKKGANRTFFKANGEGIPAHPRARRMGELRRLDALMGDKVQQKYLSFIMELQDILVKNSTIISFNNNNITKNKALTTKIVKNNKLALNKLLDSIRAATSITEKAALKH